MQAPLEIPALMRRDSNNAFLPLTVTGVTPPHKLSGDSSDVGSPLTGECPAVCFMCEMTVVHNVQT